MFMNGVSQRQQILQDLRRFVLARASIVYIQSDEEDRVEGLLKELSAQFQPRPRFFIWHPFQGLTDENEKIENTANPVDAMDKVIQRTEGTIYLFEGLLPSLTTDLLVSRKLKDVHRALRNRYSTLFVVAPSLV